MAEKKHHHYELTKDKDFKEGLEETLSKNLPNKEISRMALKKHYQST